MLVARTESILDILVTATRAGELDRFLELSRPRVLEHQRPKKPLEAVPFGTRGVKLFTPLYSFF